MAFEDFTEGNAFQNINSFSTWEQLSPQEKKVVGEITNLTPNSLSLYMDFEAGRLNFGAWSRAIEKEVERQSLNN